MPAVPVQRVTFSKEASEPVDLTHSSNKDRGSGDRNPRSLHRSSSIDSHLSDYSDRTRFDFHFPDKSVNAYSGAGKRKVRSEDPPLSPQVPLAHVVRPAKHIKKQLAEKREIEKKLSEPAPRVEIPPDPVKRRSVRVMATPLPSHVGVPEPDGRITYVDIKPGPLPTTQTILTGTTSVSTQPPNTVTSKGTIGPSTLPIPEKAPADTRPKTSSVSTKQLEVQSIPPSQSPKRPPHHRQRQSPASPREVVAYRERRDAFTNPANEVIVLEPRNTNSTVAPRVRKRKRSGSRTCLLIFWSLLLPPVAVYLAGGCGPCTAWNFLIWFLFGPVSIIHAFVMVFACPEYLEAHRGETSPEERRLREEQRYEEKMQKKREKQRRKMQKKRGEWIDVPQS